MYVIKALEDRFYNRSGSRFMTTGKIYIIERTDSQGRIYIVDDEGREHSLSKGFITAGEIFNFSYFSQQEKDLYLMLYPDLEKRYHDICD